MLKKHVVQGSFDSAWFSDLIQIFLNSETHSHQLNNIITLLQTKWVIICDCDTYIWHLNKHHHGSPPQWSFKIFFLRWHKHRQLDVQDVLQGLHGHLYDRSNRGNCQSVFWRSHQVLLQAEWMKVLKGMIKLTKTTWENQRPSFYDL